MLVNLRVPATRIGHCRGLADLRSRPPAIGLGQEQANPQHGERGRPRVEVEDQGQQQGVAAGRADGAYRRRGRTDGPRHRGRGVRGGQGGWHLRHRRRHGRSSVGVGTGSIRPAGRGTAARERLLPERSERHADVRYAHGHPLHARRERSPVRPRHEQWQGPVRAGSVRYAVHQGMELEPNRRHDPHDACPRVRRALSGFYSMDIGDRHRPVVRQMLLSNTITGGIWGRGGPIAGENGRVYGSTADGPFDPRAGDYSNAVVAASLDDLELVDHFVPKNHWELFRLDLDFGSASPVWFGWNGYNLLASGAKEGVLYLLDTDSLGGMDHQTPLLGGIRLGNDPQASTSYGIWGGLSPWRDDDGRTWLYVPLYGEPSTEAPKFPIGYGEAPDGSVIAFEVVADEATRKPVLEPAWISQNFKVPEPVGSRTEWPSFLLTGRIRTSGTLWRKGRPRTTNRPSSTRWTPAPARNCTTAVNRWGRGCISAESRLPRDGSSPSTTTRWCTASACTNSGTWQQMSARV